MLRSPREPGHRVAVQRAELPALSKSPRSLASVRGGWESSEVSEPEDIRYGVFLMPDAKTSAAVASITGFVGAQFGLVSAKRFPPHVTLAGSLPIAVGEEDLLEVVNGVAGRHVSFEIWNRGIGRLGDAGCLRHSSCCLGSTERSADRSRRRCGSRGAAVVASCRQLGGRHSRAGELAGALIAG